MMSMFAEVLLGTLQTRDKLHIGNLAVTDFNKIIASNLGNWKDSAAGGCQDDNGSDSGKAEAGSRLLRYL